MTGKPPGRDAGMPRPMTRYQYRVLVMTAAGKRQADIAALAGTSPDGVTQALKRVRERLGADTTAHAVAIAYECGLLPAKKGAAHRV